MFHLEYVEGPTGLAVGHTVVSGNHRGSKASGKKNYSSLLAFVPSFLPYSLAMSLGGPTLPSLLFWPLVLECQTCLLLLVGWGWEALDFGGRRGAGRDGEGGRGLHHS